MPNSEPPLLPGERIDRLGHRGLSIIQNPVKFKFTMDAFLLTAFVRPRPGDRLLDLGTGGGVLPLLLAEEAGPASIVGLEIQEELADMARRSVALNGLEARITIVPGDLRQPPALLAPNSFDYLIANPPYFPVQRGVLSENRALAQAKFELTCTLEDLLQAAVRLIKGNGRLALIYPSERLAELLVGLERVHLTPKRLCLIHSRAEAPSNLALIEARPGAKTGLAVLPPIVIYDQTGAYTESMNQIFLGKKI
ncbi:tRNA1Val (adenine37-N6)-methyltransferase [Hydrogenispora ethanolica]|jgi:tRNA1Val (adenine37-N6)-methyltransferase|uniref:tRNA1Val (Adenine37-N6)-methyltransferase n=1 Tax=Hydrogenispora ethanolica TaxID=1082276 RepID=A0A4V2QDE5_HYDET|nr:tRNA1(Val) (adenine(37)-N6)-methyltransferase [Hydrogenispora ethanolica]TCL63767.1 tRNA1Val (adenine37-N6)-methyltransferase [Hydrogenispora ethanolica]